METEEIGIVEIFRSADSDKDLDLFGDIVLYPNDFKTFTVRKSSDGSSYLGMNADIYFPATNRDYD